MSPTEFARIVRIGLGQAILVLRNEDSRPYRDVIVEACLHNQAYDPQVEGVRLTYLLDLIRFSSDPPYCRRRILDALRTTQPDAHYDLEQLFTLARVFADEGNHAARAAMYDRFAAKAVDPSLYLDALCLGGDQIVRMDGVAGLLFVAEHLGARMLSDKQLWADEYWLHLAEERSGPKTTKREIEQARLISRAINAYIEAVEATLCARKERSDQRPDWVSLRYDELKHLIGQGGSKVPIRGLHLWGQSACLPQTTSRVTTS